MRIQANSSILFQLAEPQTRMSPAARVDSAAVTFDRGPGTLVSNLGNFLSAQTSSGQPAGGQGGETVDANGNPISAAEDNSPKYAGNQVLFDQNLVSQNPNACGTTSLSMELADFGIIAPTYAAAREVDQAVRGWGGFTAPDDLQAYAQSQGLNSEGYNTSSLADLQTETADPENRVMVMVNGGGSPHWVVCLAVNDDPTTGKPVSVDIADPAGGQYSLPIARFSAEWKDPFAQSNDGGQVAGYSNYMQVFSDHALPAGADADIATTQILTHDVTNIANAASRLSGDWGRADVGGLFGALGKMLGNGVQGVMELPTAIGQLAGNAVSVATGASKPVATVVATATEAEIPGGAESAVAAAVTQATGSDVVGEIVGAVVDPIGAAVNAIGDFFGSL